MPSSQRVRVGARRPLPPSTPPPLLALRPRALVLALALALALPALLHPLLLLLPIEAATAAAAAAAIPPPAAAPPPGAAAAVPAVAPEAPGGAEDHAAAAALNAPLEAPPAVPGAEGGPAEAAPERRLGPAAVAAPDTSTPLTGNEKTSGQPPPLRGLRGLLSSYVMTPLVGAKCSHSLLTFHVGDIPCVRLLISKGLGIGLVAGGAIIKAPQLVKIVAKRSAVGVSFASYALETSAYIAGLAYNVRQGNPFNTYGEHAFMAVANCLVIALMFHYTERHRELAVVLTCTFLFTYSLFSRSVVSDPVLLSLQWVSILIGVVSKVPQIYENYSTRSTGQLSAVTVGLQTVGSLARCFTTATEVGDPVILITYVVATVLNGIVSWQVYIYWGRPKKRLYKLP